MMALVCNIIYNIYTLCDIEDTLSACRRVGNDQIILLKCTSAYPAPLEDVNLRTIPNMAETFNCIVGLSDHTFGIIAAVALGAKVIEKHFILYKNIETPDREFSLTPDEFKEMVKTIREVEKALSKVSYELTEKMKKSREFARSLFVVKDIKAGEIFTEGNIKSIKLGYGLHTKYFKNIIGPKSRKDIKKYPS